MRSPFDLTGRAAVVTGGNGGIGLGIAKGLAGAGAMVAIAGRNATKNAAAVAELESQGGHVMAVETDVTD
jgi:2-dehydro-3-deoxy-D-gluconate 5-dehydrogenase